MPLAITPTFSPWTHTSDDSYIYQLSLVLATARATATVSFSFPFISFAFLSLSFLVIPQIRGHITGASPLLPSRIRALLFYHEKISVLSSLVDSRRVLLTHARRSQHLVRVFLFFFANQLTASPRRDSNSRTNTSSIRGLPLDRWGDRLYPNY